MHGQDAQQVTQSILDQHKSADPTNSERSLTEKKRAETSISDVPLARVPSPQTIDRAQQLGKERDAFIGRRVEIERASAPKSLAAFDFNAAKKEASKAWERKYAAKAKELRQIEREIAKARNTQISDVPLARPKR